MCQGTGHIYIKTDDQIESGREVKEVIIACDCKQDEPELD